MPSFRAKVLDALDIKKDHVRIPCHCVFPTPAVSSLQSATSNPSSREACSVYSDFAISQTIKESNLGPQNKRDKLDMLAFVVGDDPGAPNDGLQPLPNAIDRPSDISTTQPSYTGIHYLGGLYDAGNDKLASMRASSMVPKAHQSLMWYPATGEDAGVDHTHKDWPSDRVEQAQLLQDDPYADSLYYHSTKVRFFLTGLDDVSDNDKMGDAAANHRGSVRMLVLRPKIPKVQLRVNGSGGDFVMSHDYLPNWDTELFYDRRHQIGGRINKQIGARGTLHLTDAASNYPVGSAIHNTEAITSYGLEYVNDINEHNINVDTTSPYYGHSKPTRMKQIVVNTSGDDDVNEMSGDLKHGLTPFDILTSRINTNKYAVLEDKVFTLDSLHHGAASHHVCNVTIPYNKKVRFQGRKPTVTTGTTTDANASVLSDETFDEPLNLQSRPIILFLSYNQRISAQLTGYTAISET